MYAARLKATETLYDLGYVEVILNHRLMFNENIQETNK